MNESIQLLLFGLGFMLVGGGASYLFLIAAERLCRWIAGESKPGEPK